jgi:UDP-N-acetylmuramyl pentapeptide phosphotransferase/UDP-N-acetylglucosamine-1-phosphate transferase
MDNIVLSFGLAFFVTFFAIPVIIRVAKEKKFYDEPDERKVHKSVIPTLGGLGIFGGFIFATLMGVAPAVSHQLQYFIASLLVIFFLGIKDDILAISASKKFIGQLLAAGIIIKFGGIQINNMHGFLGINEIPYMASVILTLFTIIVITNSFNLIDGVDGLAGSLGLLTSLVFGVYFLLVGQLMFATMAFALSGSLIGFLIYNFSPAKIFMGDTGSLLIGLLNSIFVIKFISLASDPISNPNFVLKSAPAIGFAVLIVPLFDTLRVFSLRIINRRSPFSPDRNHIHHFLLELGLSHKMITAVCISANILFIALAYFLQSIGTTMVVLALATAAVIFVGIVYYSKPKPKLASTETREQEQIIKSHKILTLAAERVEQD